jgi:hypothetical protein
MLLKQRLHSCILHKMVVSAPDHWGWLRPRFPPISRIAGRPQRITSSATPPQRCARNCKSASLNAAGFWIDIGCVAWGMVTRRLPGMHRTTTSLIRAKYRRVRSPPTTRVGAFTPPSVAQETAGGGGAAIKSGTVLALSRII